MKIPYHTAVKFFALSALLSAAPCALASIVDQSQLNANIALPFDDLSIGQSFNAGISGSLTDIDVISNGPISGGSNFITLDLYSGSGIGSQLQLLGELTNVSVSSVMNSALNSWIIDINTQDIIAPIVAGQEYTFAISHITGTGDLNTRGLLANAFNPYLNGQAFNTSLGNQSNWDLAFQTQVNAVPIPTMFWLSAAGFIGIIRIARKHIKVG
jgi:hypothetical protein